MVAAIALLSFLTTGAFAQFPPKPEGVKTLKSKFHPGITISYKEPGICETTPGVKSYAGYVHLPVDALNETHEHNGYPINTFFWFFESRKDPANAPLSIWLNGGPGGSSLLGLLSEQGPCFVNNDSATTRLNPWSWNNEANILYIDQPNQVGFSYDVLTNVTVNLLSDEEGGEIVPTDFSHGVPAQNSTFFVGTVGSQNVSNTANSTHHAAVAMWHFAQTFFEEFPAYKPNDERISLFTESYGGHYGPGIIDYFVRQNKRIEDGEISGPGAHYLHLDTLGIVNGCIDPYAMSLSSLTFAYNNTYGIEIIDEKKYKETLHEWEKPGGVWEAVQKCQELQKTTDPRDHGDVARTNKVCVAASERMMDLTEGTFAEANRGARFDITHDPLDPFPDWYMLGWLNSAEVQKALGVPVNHTWASPAVATAFDSTGDFAKAGQLENIGRLLDSGVHVAMMYGDRDWACNWVGGEMSSVALAWSRNTTFVNAGYAPVALSSPYVQSAGLVRQHGNLSFTRVYQAGHMVPSYQPEAAWQIFQRAITHRDIATGAVDLHAAPEYATDGQRPSAWSASDVLPSPPHECYVLAAGMRCTEEELSWIRDGTAIIKDYILVGRQQSSSTAPRLTTDGAAGAGGQYPLRAEA